MKTKTVAWERFTNLEELAKQTAEKLDRLIDHVNREIGVAGKIPLHKSFDPFVGSKERRK